MEFREYLDFALKTVLKIICRILWKGSLNLLLNNKGGLGLGFSHSLIYQQNLKNLKLVISVVVVVFFFSVMQCDSPALVQMLMKCKKYRVIVTKHFFLMHPPLRHSCLSELVIASHLSSSRFVVPEKIRSFRMVQCCSLYNNITIILNKSFHNSSSKRAEFKC